MLSLLLMLQVTYNWKPGQFEQRIEYRMHGFILVSSFVVALVPLFFQGYNPSCGICGNPTPLPLFCGNWIFGDGTTECLRGSATLANAYVAILFLSVSGAALFCTGAMIVIFWTVYKQERTMAQYRREGNHQESFAISRSLRKKMMLYTSTFYICWILPTLFIYLPGVPPALTLVGHALVPLMGFLNMLVFILPKCVKYQREHPGTRLRAAYCHVLLEISSTPIRRWPVSRRGHQTQADGASIGAAAADVGRGCTRGANREPVKGLARDVEVAEAGATGEQELSLVEGGR